MRFVIRHVGDDRIQEALDFHHQHIGEYLFPRTLEKFKELAEELCLYEAVDETGAIIGLCYVDNSEERAEFGGIYVKEGYRGYGIASSLGLVVISVFMLMTGGQTELIAHVHEFNDDPRGILAEAGFAATGEQEEAPDIPETKSMKRNDEGKIVGDVFRLEKKSLHKYAQKLESLLDKKTVKGKDGSDRSVEVKIRALDLEPHVIATALHEIADS